MDLLRGVALVFLPLNALLALAIWCPNFILTWVFFGLAVAWLPASAFLMLHLDERRARCFRRDLDEFDRRSQEDLRRIWSLRYARRVRKAAPTVRLHRATQPES
jgi:hypothetical protein